MDLTIKYILTCSSNLSWRKNITGSKGKIYEVRYGPMGGPYCYDWSCTCPSFQYHKGDCKHIIQAKKEKCCWNMEAFMGNDAATNPDGSCPLCGGKTEAIRVGI